MIAKAKEVLVLQHVSNEGAGSLADFMAKEGILWRTVALYKGEPLPEDWSRIRAVLIMGGPMNVYEESKHPFLKAEDIFIRQLLERHIPCLGICLGSQLIAKALGHRVYKARKPEIGWLDVRLTPAAAEDALFSEVAAAQLRVLQWHEDTFDLPKGAVHLASSKVAPYQAYRWGDRVYAFQFHVEINRQMLQDWFVKREDLGIILAEHASYQDRLKTITEKIYRKFFSLPA